ncbi:MAG: hypothetical protein HS126_27025 [Anaerolineales bacterium]|nr:hypothetical protein [Anaerolineales bacterium]
MSGLSAKLSRQLALLVVLFSLFIGLYNLGDTRIAADELKTFRTIEFRSPFEVVSYYHTSSHLLHSFLLTIIYQFTTHIYFFRLVSVVFAVLTVAMTYRWSRTFLRGRQQPFGHPASADGLALGVSFLLAITPIFVRYQREIRGYSATVFFGLIIFFCLWQIAERVRKGQSPSKYWGLFIAASVLGLYTHFFMIFALLAVTVIVALEWLSAGERTRAAQTLLRPYLLSLVAVALLLGLLLTPLVGQIVAVPETEGRYVSDFISFSLSWGFVQQYLEAFQLFSPLSDFKELPDIFLALALVGAVNNWRLPQRRRQITWLVLWWLIPFAAIPFFLLLVPWGMAQARFYLFTLPAYLLLGLYGLEAVVEGAVTVSGKRFRPALGVGLAILLMALAIPSLVNLFTNLNRLTVEQAWTSVAAHLQTHVQADDLILCEAFELPGGDEAKCRWQLNQISELTTARLPIPYFSAIAEFRGAEKRREMLEQRGQVWFVLYFRDSTRAQVVSFEDAPGVTTTRVGTTWLVRVSTGDSLLENLTALGEWLLKALPDEDHQFRYHLDVAQLYALAGEQENANRHLEQAVQLQQQSNEASRIPELRTVAALVRFYAPAKPTPQHGVNVNFDNRLTLSGYSLEPQVLSAAQSSLVSLSLYWQVSATPEKDYSVFVHLKDSGNQMVSSFDFQPFDAIYPMSYWSPGVALREARQFTLPANLPPGEYTLAVGIYWPGDLSRLKIIDDPTGENEVRLGKLVVNRS